jgi:hypothetical protein
MEKIMTDKQTFEDKFDEADKLHDELHDQLIFTSNNYDPVVVMQSACMLIKSEFSQIKNKKMREFLLFSISREFNEMVEDEHDEDDELDEVLTEFNISEPTPGKPH